MKPVENDGILPESEVSLDTIANTGGTVRKEYKAPVFHEPVLKKERDKQFEGLVHADCRQCVLLVFRLDMYDCVLNERPVLPALSLALWLLVSYTDVVDTDIAASLGSVLNA